MVERFRATLFSSVPTVYSTLLATPIDGIDLSSLRYAICGAAAMPLELIRNFEARPASRCSRATG